MTGKRIYFASDMHLGLPARVPSMERERRLVRWLDTVRTDAQEIFLLGDIFDFWHEYRHVIPKGFARFQGAVARITDAGIPVHFFTGNHDVWMYGYFAQELGVTIHRACIQRELFGRSFLIGHGDGLGHGDWGYKLLKGCFTNPLLQWLFARIHPNLSMRMGHRWSRSSRSAKAISRPFRGERELITRFVRQHIRAQPMDYYVFGHWHSPAVYPLGQGSTLVILGDWIENFTYGVWDGQQISLLRFEDSRPIPPAPP